MIVLYHIVILLQDPTLWQAIATLPAWMKLIAILVSGGGLWKGVEKGGKALVSYMRADSERDAQEHEQTLELSEAEAEFRSELRREIRSLHEKIDEQATEMAELRKDVRMFENWARELVFAVKHERYNLQRSLIQIDDLRSELDRPPLDPEQRKRYKSERYESALTGTPWGDLRGFSGPAGRGKTESDDDEFLEDPMPEDEG